MAQGLLVQRFSIPRLLLIFALVLATTSAFAGPPERPKTHVVYAGQRLGSIAKRYNVSIEALCNANGIRERDRTESVNGIRSARASVW
jgi:LysM repeat protein